MEQYPSVAEGDSGVGKTNIITRYLNDSFTDEENQTIAVQFFRKKVETRKMCYWIHLWDTGGQPRFEAITTVYYRGSKAVLIVFDITNRSTFLSINRWYDKVKMYTDTSKGNKSDLEKPREVERCEIDKLTENFENCHYFEVSAKKGIGIEKMFMTLGVNLSETGVRDKFKLDIGLYRTPSETNLQRTISTASMIRHNPLEEKQKSECCNMECSTCTIL